MSTHNGNPRPKTAPAAGAGPSHGIGVASDRGDWSNPAIPPVANTQLYGSKRDLWELSTAGISSASRDAGASALSASSPMSTKRASPQPNTASVSPAPISAQLDSVNQPPVKKNSIFEVNHTVLKPVSKMSEEELKALRSPVLPNTSLYPINSSDDSCPTDLEPKGSIDRFNPRKISPERSSRIPPTPPLPVSAQPPSSSVLSRGPHRGFVDLDEDVIKEWARPPQQQFPTSSSLQNKLVVDTSSTPKESMFYTPQQNPFGATVTPTPSIPIRNVSRSSTSVSNTPTNMIGFRKSVPNRRRTGSSTNKLPSSSQQRFPTDPPNLALTFLPLAKNFLGYGRYAKVYRAHYTLRETSGDGAGNGFQTPKGSTMHIPVPPSSSLMSPLNSDGNSLNFSRILVSPHGEDKAITSFEDSVDDDVRPCAVKQMHATRECTEIALTEARVLRMLSGHPNIVRLIGLMSEDDSPSKMSKRPSRISVGGEETEIDFDSSFDDDDTSDFDNFVDDGDDEFEEGCSRMLIVLELADFGTMMDYISNAAGEGIGQQLWMDWAKQLASAVDYVHSLGFVHHDIKPHNCLLVSLSFVELQLNDGKTETLSVKLADFGNALPVQGFQPPPGTAPVSPMSPSVLPESQPHASLLESREMTMSPTPPSPLQLAVRDSSTSSRMHSVDFAGPMANTSTPFGSIGNATTPVSFVERFKSEMSDASIRSSRTGSLTDGLGRGTQAYMAPEIFMATPSKSAGEYSFPVDIYATGCTLFVAATGIAPFSGGVGGSVYVMMGIKRGFWASGMQIGFGPLGPDVSPQPNMAGPRGRDMRRSLCCDDSLPSTGIRANRWLQDGDTVPGGEGVVKFGNGDALDVEAVRIMCACLEAAAVRPTARELVVWLNTLF